MNKEGSFIFYFSIYSLAFSTTNMGFAGYWRWTKIWDIPCTNKSGFYSLEETAGLQMMVIQIMGGSLFILVF
jgi:hypothetical protein